jgi:uncharacterized protein YggE
MAENSGLLVVGIIVVVLITAGLTYFIVKSGTGPGPTPPVNQTVNETGQPPTITVRGEATKTILPDQLTIGITIETTGANVSDSQAENAKESAKVRSALLSAGVKEGEIQTSSYSTYPVYNDSCYDCYPYPVPYGDSGGKAVPAGNAAEQAGVAYTDVYPSPPYMPPCKYQENCSIIGYKTVNAIMVKTGSVNDGGKFVDAALGAGTTAKVDYIYFSLKDETRVKAESELQSEAAVNAHDKAESIAKGLGASLGKIVSVNTDYYPIYPVYAYDRAASAESAPPTQISPSDTTLSSSITVVFELAQKAI